MEKRKESLSTLNVCRFCLNQDDSLSSLYDRTQKPNNAVPLSLKILSCLSVEVFPSDKMPSYICKRCIFFMDLFYEYKQICRKADERILQYIQKGTALETLNIPVSLTKIFRVGFRQTPMKNPCVVKTIVEGGATVQVTSHDVSHSEEEDEDNVYNIKIGDDSTDGSKCIKLVTSKADLENKQDILNPRDFNSVSKLSRHLRTHAGDRPYPCKYCEKSFTKSHHYTRHVRLKHRGTIRGPRGPFGQMDQYRCDQCEAAFATQDELIYHSAIHATQNLTCPLCQEKFDNVDAVTAHIKSHVNGIEFMCDLCELVFTTKEKLDFHLTNAHADEIRSANELGQDDSSMDNDGDDDEDDNEMNVKEEDGEMVVEIKKADGFMLPEVHAELEAKHVNLDILSEDSDQEATYTELSTVDTLAIVRKEAHMKQDTAKPEAVRPTAKELKSSLSADSQTASILRKAEEVKRKVQLSSTEITEKKMKLTPKEGSNSSGGASDKSLRLLEKELQELKRTNTRNEVSKTPAKPIDNLRNRRPQLYTSTPKPRTIEEKKAAIINKALAVEKKLPERKIITKENKEPKDTKPVNCLKEDKEREAKEAKEKELREKERDLKEREMPKSAVKNGTKEEKTQPEEAIRRSTRPSKIKDYAKMIRDKAQDSSDDDSDDADDEEYREIEKPEVLARNKRRGSKTPMIIKPAAAPAPPPAPSPSAVTAAVSAQPPATPMATAPPPVRKRGRPRKEPPKEILPKVKKDDIEEQESVDKMEVDDIVEKTKDPPAAVPERHAQPSTPVKGIADGAIECENDANKSPGTEQKTPGGVLVSPSGQTLKKVPIRALPPGVKPLPLPVHARPTMGPGELCEMQIGKKVVKVQKIVMTKAEVEAMAKKGLVEMKDGTMVLKQGIKLPSAESFGLKSTLVADREAAKESPSKIEKPVPQTSVSEAS